MTTRRTSKCQRGPRGGPLCLRRPWLGLPAREGPRWARGCRSLSCQAGPVRPRTCRSGARVGTRLPAPQPPLPLSPLGLAAAPRMDQTPAARAEARSQATDRRSNTDAADPVPNVGQQLPPAGPRPCERPPPSRAAAGGRRGAAMSATLPEKPEGAASAPPSEFLSRVPSRRQSPTGRSRALPERRQRRRDPERRPSPSARRAAQKPHHRGPASQPACPPARGRGRSSTPAPPEAPPP